MFLCGEPVDVIMEMNKEIVRRYRWFSITFYLNEFGSNVDIEVPEYPPSIVPVRGPYIRLFDTARNMASRDQIIPDEIPMERGVRIDYSFRADQTGRFIIDSFTFRGQGKEITSDPFLVTVGVLKNEKLVVPPDVSWVLTQDDGMVGEHIGVLLMVHNLDKITTFDSISIPSIEGGNIDEEVTIGTIETTTSGPITLYHVPATSLLLTPLKAGDIVLPSATVTLNGVDGSAEQISFQVRPAPVEIEETGAIGSFSYTSRVVYPEDERQKNEATIRYYQHLEGCGNFGFLTVPEPTFAGLDLLSVDDDLDITPSDRGYCGYLRRTYRFQTTGTEQPIIDDPGFIWFDNAAETIDSITGSRKPLLAIGEKASEEESREETSATKGKPIYTPFALSAVKRMKSRQLYKSPWNYLFLLPGVLCLFFGFTNKSRLIPLLAGSFFVLIASGTEVDTFTAVQQGIEAFQRQEYEEALSFFSDAAKKHPNNAGILYNIGVTYYYLENYGEAVYHTRQAFHANPMNRKIRETVLELEYEGDIAHQLELPIPIDPDVPYVGFLLLFNGFSAVLLINGMLKKKKLSIFLPALAFLIIIALAVFIFSAANHNSAWAVVKETQPIKKIPRESGIDWFYIDEGTTVAILEEATPFYFIKTGTGVQGWIKKNSLFLDRRDF